MRRWVIVGSAFAASLWGERRGLAEPDGRAGPDQRASEVEAAAPVGTPPGGPVQIGYAALPGGRHAVDAELAAPGTFVFAALSGYGYRSGLLSAGHTMTRAIGHLAVAYAPTAHLMIGLSLDGRYDKHTGFAANPDDGYVGDPHLLARTGSSFGRVKLAAQLGLWVPGKDAPSIAASAISGDARVIATIDAGFGAISFDAGFRLDNSAKSVDEATKLSVEDRVSLGVSSFHAAVGGIMLRVPVRGRSYAGLEGSAELYLGSGAPRPLLRGGALVGVAISDAITVVGFVELAKVPGLSYGEVLAGNVALVPYEPSVTGGLGLQAYFGGGKRAAGNAHANLSRNLKPESVAVVETADISGIVFDDAGKPVVGAKVTIKLKNNTGVAITDSKGAYALAKVPIGKTLDGKTTLDDTGAEISAELANKKPASATMTLTRGANAAPPITLDSFLPPGQLRAVITSAATSRAIAGATVAIEPGGLTATSGPDGKFTIDLPPGRYKLTVTARGLAQQQLDVNIEQNGVSIKNIELRK
jgi:hypothetical protein